MDMIIGRGRNRGCDAAYYISIPEFSYLACEGLTGLTPCLLPEVTVGLAQYAIKESLEPVVGRQNIPFFFLHLPCIKISKSANPNLM
jgi:hypothetical protein